MILERLGIPGANVLGTNYTVTSLTVSDYNPNIDSTVTLTVTVKDVYNRPVVGEEVTVTASEGNFTQYNGSTITGASSYTGTTNSSGQFTLTYACSEWGLITFSANNKTLQIHVKGIISIPTVTYGTMLINRGIRLVQFKYYREGYNFTGTGQTTLHTEACGNYKPQTEMACATSNPTISLVVSASGNIRVQSTSTGSKTIEATATWYY